MIKVATSGGVLSARDDPRHAHFRPAELDALVEEATAAGMFVMAHAQGADGIKNAVRAGIRSIEHGIYLDDEAIELMLRRGTWFVPTLVAPQGVLDAVGRRDQPAAGRRGQGPDGHRHPPGGLPAGRRGRRPDRDGHRQRRHAPWPQPARARAHGRRWHGPAAVLEATTRSAAELLGVDDDLGTIEEGKLADLVVVAGDPYDFVATSATGSSRSGRAASESSERSSPGGRDGRPVTAIADRRLMTRRADPDRIEAARRAAAVARLIGAGELPARAAAWVARWEATVDGVADRAAWESFDDWLARERPNQSVAPGRHDE